MSASEQLTEQQRTRLLTAHHSFHRREMTRYWFLSEEDLRRINERRREHNRLGFAVQLCLLRYPDWPLRPDEVPRPNLLDFVAEQLGADATEIHEYATRDQTRREHV
jgi:TnpA family transposase